MYKKLVASILSCVSLTTIAQAGTLYLEADLSDEQKKVINRKYVDSLQYMGYGDIRYKKKMCFSTPLVSNVQVNDAEKIAEKYIEIIKSSGAREVSTTPHLPHLGLEKMWRFT